MEESFEVYVQDQKKRDVSLRFGPTVNLEFLLNRAAERPSIFGRTSKDQCSKTGFLSLCALAVAKCREELIDYYSSYTSTYPPDFILDPIQVFEGYEEPLYFFNPNTGGIEDFGVTSGLVVVKNYSWGTPDTGLAFNTGGKGNYVVRRDELTGVLLAERVIPNELINYGALIAGPYLPDFVVKVNSPAGMEVRKIFFDSLMTIAPNGVHDIEYIVNGLIGYGCGIDVSELTYTEAKYLQ